MFEGNILFLSRLGNIWLTVSFRCGFEMHCNCTLCSGWPKINYLFMSQVNRYSWKWRRVINAVLLRISASYNQHLQLTVEQILGNSKNLTTTFVFFIEIPFTEKGYENYDRIPWFPWTSDEVFSKLYFSLELNIFKHFHKILRNRFLFALMNPQYFPFFSLVFNLNALSWKWNPSKS